MIIVWSDIYQIYQEGLEGIVVLKELFKYTKMEYLRSILDNGIYAAKLTELNDPYEAEGILYPEKYRVCCATTSPMKMLMWSYYGQHRECVVGFLPKINMEKVEYVRRFESHKDFTQEEVVRNLLKKGAEWKPENEYRQVWFSENSNPDIWTMTEKDKVFLKAKIVEVRFGVCSHLNPFFVDALGLLKDYNEGCADCDKIKVLKYTLSSKKYSLVEEKQWDYLEEYKKC